MPTFFNGQHYNMKFRQCFVRMFFSSDFFNLLKSSHPIRLVVCAALSGMLYTSVHMVHANVVLCLCILSYCRQQDMYVIILCMSINQRLQEAIYGYLDIYTRFERHQQQHQAAASATATAANNSALEILHMFSILWPNTFQKANANAKSNWMRQSLRSFTFGSVRHLNKKDHTHSAGAALK